ITVSYAMAAAAVPFQAHRTHSSPVTVAHRRPNISDNSIHIRRNSYGRRRFIVSASKSPIEEPNSNSNDPESDLPFTPQGDLNFLLKLGAGSFIGAAAIKYGSILVPEITRPNITQALVMISTPVLVSVLILIKESRVER
ncbi:hypothetical protein OSB04_030403, partial [Centaurea solstitialis]